MEDEQPAREANKVCGVCGDRALGYNFNAVSCESCKAFFRRNAVKNKDFRCPFTENCTITPVTRRFCQKCRLDKCFSIGMRKEYIMSEEDKVLKRQKIEQNRAKKRPKLETYKNVKTKKSGVTESNFDDASMSVNSVASTVSETYFWESDKKYADLDGNRQHTMDNMSPVTAASVPSPLSPLEGADIGGSKTLDMLKESPQNGMPNFVKFEQVSCCSEKDANLNQSRENIDPLALGASRFNELPQRSRDDIGNKNSSPAKKKILSTFDHVKNNSLNCDHEYDANVSAYSSFEQNSTQHSSSLESTCDAGIIYDLSPAPSVNVDGALEESTLCQKSKETCTKKVDLSTDFSQNPELVTKFASNPNLVAKIIHNEDVIKKILTDPDIINKLSADPEVSEFIEGIQLVNKRQDQLYNKVDTHHKESSENNDMAHSTLRHIFKYKQCCVENPILTDLITNRNSENSKDNVSEISTSTDINKNMTDVTRDVVQDVQRIPIAANSIESILCEAIKLEFSAYSALGGNHISRELNDAERAKLNELIVANKSLLAPLDDDLTNLVDEECRFKNNFGQSDPMLLDVINLTAIAIRRLIKMSKKINAFKNMCQEDQLALLKGGCTEMLILRSALNYDHDKDMWKIPHSQEKMSNIKVDVLKEAKGNLYAEHARFVRTFDPRWRDENIILILSAIALFTPDRPRVIHSDVIKLEQNSYYYLLRRYLESIYPGCEAKSTFLKLIQKISELHRLNDEVVGVYLNVNPSSVEPLLIEIFDLKH